MLIGDFLAHYMHFGFIYFYFNSNLHNIFCEEVRFCQLIIKLIKLTFNKLGNECIYTAVIYLTSSNIDILKYKHYNVYIVE